MTRTKSIYHALLRFFLRVVAWASTLVLALSLFAVLLLTNLNTLTPNLVKQLSARTGAQVNYEHIGLGWIDDSLVLRLANLAVQRDSPQEQFEFESDLIEIRVSKPSTDHENWEVAKFEVLRPRVVSHQPGMTRSKRDPSSPDLNPAAAISNGIGLLSLVKNINIVDGEYEFNIGQDDEDKKFKGGFQIEGLSADGTNHLSVRMTSSEHDKTQILLNLSNERQADGSDQTDLEFIAKSVELARLLSALPDNPVTAKLDLSKLHTQVDSKVYAQLNNSEIDSLEFSFEVNDPNLARDIPGAEQAKLSAVGNVTLEDSKPSRVNVNLELDSLDVAEVLRQQPAAFPPKFYKHVSSRLRSLWLTNLSATLSADAKTMLKRDGDWDLKAKGAFSNFTYKFQEKWPPLENGQGIFEIDGTKVTITGEKGLFHGRPVKHASAKIENFLVDDPIMTIVAGIDVPVSTAIDFFGEDGTVSPGTLDWIDSGKGAGVVELGINVPLRRGKEFGMYGEISLADVDITTTQFIEAQDISGQLNFARSGITKGKLAGQMLGGPFAMDFTGSGTKGNFIVAGHTSGTADSSAFDEILGEPIAQKLSGSLDWTGDFRFAPQESEIDISASLTNVISTLPFPMKKGAGLDMPIRATVTTKNGTTRSIEASVGSQVNASITSALHNREWRTESGVISVGAPTPGRESEAGVSAYIDLPKLDYGAWSGLAPSKGGTSGSGIAQSLDFVVLNTDELILAGKRKLQNAQLTAEKKDTHWDINLTTDTLAGTAYYRSSEFVNEGEYPFLEVDLSICHLPASQSAPPTNPTDPTELPALHFRCSDTRYGQFSLGQSTIEAEPGSNSWKITRAQFSSPIFTIHVDGDWFYNQTSKLDFKFNSVDFGRALSSFGFPPAFKRGKMEIAGTLQWDAALTQWTTHQTSGEIKISSKDGVFVTESSSDIQKVVGVLNYETIFQKFSNDVVDVLDEDGILYDTISGTMQLKNGVFQVDGVVLDGPSLSMAVTGETSWNNKQHNLNVGVEPKIRNSITTLATLLINPVTGVLVYAGGKLAEQLDVNFTYVYDISGSWDKPVITLKTS